MAISLAQYLENMHGNHVEPLLDNVQNLKKERDSLVREVQYSKNENNELRKKLVFSIQEANAYRTGTANSNSPMRLRDDSIGEASRTLTLPPACNIGTAGS